MVLVVSNVYMKRSTAEIAAKPSLFPSCNNISERSLRCKCSLWIQYNLLQFLCFPIFFSLHLSYYKELNDRVCPLSLSLKKYYDWIYEPRTDLQEKVRRDETLNQCQILQLQARVVSQLNQNENCLLEILAMTSHEVLNVF